MTELDPDLTEIAERLQHSRPVPAPAFRGDLRRRLLRHGAPASRPRRLWLRVTAYGLPGAALLLCGLASAAGAGPLGA
jgi:hypothetical protein